MLSLPTKKKFLSPIEILENCFQIEKGKSVIEFGAGSGYWTTLLAKKVGSSGSIYAIDNNESSLSVIKRKVENLGLKNTKLFVAPYSSKGIPIKEKADYILLTNILSLSKNWHSLIRSTKNNAKKDAKLLIVDWKEEKVLGHNQINEWIEEIILAAKEAGFEFRKLVDAGDFHFGLYFEHKGGKNEKSKKSRN